jgi:hypothetical protein
VGLGSRRILLLAVATGALVAVFLTLATKRFVRLGAVAAEQMAEAPAEVAPEAEAETVEVAPPAEAAPPESGAVEPVPAAPAPAPAPATKVRSSSGARPLSAESIAGSGGKKEPGGRVKASSGKASVKPAPAEPQAGLVSNEEAEAEALSHYEAGHVDSALTLARRARLEPLATTLARFQEEWRAGNASLANGDPSSAVLHLSAALELDQKISQGWGSLAPRIRKALTQAQTQVGAGK